MFLFAIPFAVAGLFCLVSAWVMCWEAQRVRMWEQLSAKVDTVPEEKQGDWENLKYRYRWEGRWVTATGGVAKNFTDTEEQNAFWKTVQEAKEYEETLPVWVNPKRPEESFLLPPRPSFAPLAIGLFAITHGGVGLGLMTGSILSLIAGRFRAKAQKLYPDEPWKWRRDWGRGVAKVAKAPWHWFFGYLAMVVLSIGGWIGFLLFTDSAATIGSRIIALVLIGVGSFVGWISLRKFKFHQRSQQFTLKLPPNSLITGAVNRLTLEDSAASAYRMREATRTWTLDCIGGTPTGEDSAEAALWSGEVDVKAESGRTRELNITIPAGAPLTSNWSSSGEGVRWELMGKGMDRSKLGPFLLPVFRESEVPQEAVETFPQEADDEPLNPEDWDAAFRAEQIEIEAGASPRFSFGPRRHTMPATTSLIIGIAFTAVGGGIMLVPELMVKLFGSIFGIVGLFTLRSGLWQNFGSYAVEADPQGLRLTKTLFGRTRQTTWAADEIEDIVAADAASYNNVAFFVVHLCPKAGKKKTITPLFADWSTADAFAKVLRESLR